MAKQEHAKKIVYQRPEVVDLGAMPQLYGAVCQPTGSTAAGNCTNGGTATGSCTGGSTASKISVPLGPRVP